MGFLSGLGIGEPETHSSEDLENFRRMAVDNSKYDAEARRRGFKNGDQMVQFYRNRGNPFGGTVSRTDNSQAGAFARSQGPKMLHPKNLFEYIGRAYKEATEGNGN